MFRRIAIIGGGAASASLLGELLDRPLSPPLQVDWYTGGTPRGRGVAYATASPRHLLNVRAASMGLYSSRPGSFLEFAQQRDQDVGGKDFLPRRLYGDYLAAEIDQAVAHGKAHGHDVTLIPADAEAVIPETGGVTVMHGGQTRRMDAAVLAIGALPPQTLDGVEPAALESGRYVLDPWQLLPHPEPAVPPRHVLLIGSGLTAADTVVELAARWPGTRFTLISVHGRWPGRHPVEVSAPRGGHDGLIDSLRAQPEVRRWLRLLREAAAEEGDWRSVVDSLRPHTSGLWQGLPTAQRARFLRHARSAWERARHRLPPQVAATLDELQQSGRIELHGGRMRSVIQGAGDQLRVIFSHGGAVHELEADMVIQTTGLATDARRTSHPLLSQLRDDAHVMPDELGLGLLATPEGHLKHAGGHWPHLFTLGSLLRGTLWECTALPEIRQQARTIAQRLLAA
ncbi:MAG: FAD/NAD(P)-binding protein [Xanthomonadales bacterium]|nr:FAD/NAD(P)-binding protein [Xanthomonadales bacterium]